VLLAAEIAVLYGPVSLADSIWLSLIFGIVSGAAMLPYTIIKEVNSSSVAGTATGIMNLLVFATSAAISAVVGGALVRLGQRGGLHAIQFREVGSVSVASVVLAIALACFLLETGDSLVRHGGSSGELDFLRGSESAERGESAAFSERRDSIVSLR